VFDQLSQGKHVVLTIDTQGALQLRGRFPAVFIFIKPPSFGELEKRLINRKTETEEVIAERLTWMHQEMEAAHQYDYNLVNDDLEVAYQVLRSILIAEDHRIDTNGA
jgi:guanylate kinase